ncbi:MAG: TlpA family protein disulfide reductase [Lawsonibacter sp.]|nr:TlpA family protein disulfide reductase [Lawsonibacter sp.]
MHKRYHIVSGLLILLLVLLCGCAKTDGESPDLAGPAVGTANEPPAQSEPQSEEESAPIFITFEGMDLEGNTISEDVFLQSKLTMVNVWATYCGPCLNEMPGLGELAAEYDRAEFQIIGIVSDAREGEDPSLVEELVQQTGADYPHLLANASIDQAFLAGVSGVPTTFFFDGEGAYLGGIVGAADKSTWEELIHELLEEA